LSKASGGSANSRVIGSVAFVNHARAAFIVTADPDDPGKRLFLPSKTNLGKPRQGLAYRIADTALPGPEFGTAIWAPYVQWEDTPVTISADQAMAAMAGGPEGRTAIEEAKQFLIDILSAGEVPAKEVKAAADAQMISAATLRRAKSALGVQVKRDGFGPGSTLLWSLSSPIDAQTSNRCSSKKMSTYDVNEHLCAPKTHEEFEERAAILQYEGGLTRSEAEARAKIEFPEMPDFLRRVQ
jgi:putative DNA primase/helicase